MRRWGYFCWLLAATPLAHLSLIWFTVWSSVVHGGIMALQSLANSEHRGHPWGDVLALFVVAAVLCASDATRCGSKPRLCQGLTIEGRAGQVDSRRMEF